jgi:hypothetical protein
VQNVRSSCVQVATLALQALNFLFLGVSACADHSQLLKNRPGAARRTLTVFLGVELLMGGPPMSAITFLLSNVPCAGVLGELSRHRFVFGNPGKNMLT